MTRQNRDAIRRQHRPVGPERQCAVHDEQWPCDASELLEDLELVELETRRQYEQVQQLGRHVEGLEARISRAVRELT